MNEELGKKIQRWLNEATLGLEGDHELRLEVQTELRSHLDGVYQERIEGGMEEEEAINDALKSMGDASEITSRLVEANRSRMKFRSWVGVALRRVLVPVSIVAALWVIHTEIERNSVFQESRASGSGARLHWLEKIASVMGVEATQERALTELSEDLQTEDQLLLMAGAEEFTAALQRKKALWENEPESPKYYAEYLRFFLSVHGTLPEDFRETVDRIDPDNAYFYLIEARVALSDTVEEKRIEGGRLVRPIEWEVTDPEKIQRGFEVFHRAMECSRYDSYKLTLLEERASLLPLSGDLSERLMSVDYQFASSIAGSRLGSFGLKGEVSARAGQLVEENDVAGLLKLVESWKTRLRLWTAEEDLLESKMLALFFAETTAQHLLKSCKALGLTDQVSEIEAILARVKVIGKNWRERICGELSSKHDGIWGNVVSSVESRGDDQSIIEAYKPSRELRYLLVERKWVMSMVFVLALMIVGCSLVTLRWRLYRKGALPPMFLLLRFRDYAWILGWSVLLPLILFYCLTRYTPLGHREWSWELAMIAGGVQYCLMGLLVVVLLLQMTRICVRRRLRDLGESSVPLLSRRQVMLVPAGLVFGIVSLGFVSVENDLGMGTRIILLAVGLMTLGWLVVRVSHSVSGGRKPKIYAGALTRSLIPILGLAIILLSSFAVPALSYLEGYWLGEDDTILPNGIGRVEQEASEWLRSDLEDALALEE